MNQWVLQIDNAIEDLEILKKALNGEDISDSLEDEPPSPYCFMATYELIESTQQVLSNISHDLLRKHVILLEKQVTEMIKKRKD